MLLRLASPNPGAIFLSLALTESVVLSLTDVFVLRVPCMVDLAVDGGTVEQVRYVQFEVVQIEPILEAGEEGFGAVLVHFQKRQ